MESTAIAAAQRGRTDGGGKDLSMTTPFEKRRSPRMRTHEKVGTNWIYSKESTPTSLAEPRGWRGLVFTKWKGGQVPRIGIATRAGLRDSYPRLWCRVRGLANSGVPRMPRGSMPHRCWVPFDEPWLRPLPEFARRRFSDAERAGFSSPKWTGSPGASSLPIPEDPIDRNESAFLLFGKADVPRNVATWSRVRTSPSRVSPLHPPPRPGCSRNIRIQPSPPL